MTLALKRPAPITHDDMVFQPWITAYEIDQRVTDIARWLGTQYAGKQVRLITVLNGAQPFANLLAAKLKEMSPGPSSTVTDSLRVKSYEGTTSGRLKWLQELDHPTSPDIHDVIFEGIADSGRTLSHLVAELGARRPASLRTVVLLDRPEARADGVTFVPDIVGFHIQDPEVWAIGFGMDLDEDYRGEPHIYGKVVDGRMPPAFSLPPLPLLS